MAEILSKLASNDEFNRLVNGLKWEPMKLNREIMISVARNHDRNIVGYGFCIILCDEAGNPKAILRISLDANLT